MLVVMGVVVREVFWFSWGVAGLSSPSARHGPSLVLYKRDREGGGSVTIAFGRQAGQAWEMGQMTSEKCPRALDKR